MPILYKTLPFYAGFIFSISFIFLPYVFRFLGFGYTNTYLKILKF